jgi:hypothetical protein
MFVFYLNPNKMKKLFLLLSLISITNLFSQETEKPTTTTTTTTVVTTTSIPVEEKKSEVIDKKNEFRVDPFYMVFAGALNVNYERIINEESGAGISFLISNGKDINTTFSVSPYYRFYFGKKTAAGFFFEGFAMYSSFKANEIINQNNNTGIIFYGTQIKEVTKSDFAIGFGLGGKWITRKGVIFELNTGIGRNLFGDYDKYESGTQITGKGGISIGYRFN